MDGQGDGDNGSAPQGHIPPEVPGIVANPLMGDAVSDWSPMHEAAVHGRLLSLENLIQQGWPVNLFTTEGVSPLHEACLGGHTSCVNILLDHGAQVNGLTADWHTPLYNACVNGNHECVNVLLQHGAIPDSPCGLASPIHEVAKRGHVECLEVLLEYGGNMDCSISHLGSPLYLACENLQIACAKKLLESGANVTLGKGLESPLHAVARQGNKELASLLLDFGADPHTRNADNKRPVELVAPNNALIQFLLEQEGPPPLMQLCRLRIRKCFAIREHYKIATLGLPEELKHFLLHI
ncbi:ankyrin repeat and SOCS box protein 9 [Tenrec ecaudatus]|uniref:ankyrin repeat and SOCS box protein 9 n=1 Tax=Tenrec ecaudatus TaxID=94439 RepID=UPI003F59BD82